MSSPLSFTPMIFSKEFIAEMCRRMQRHIELEIVRKCREETWLSGGWMHARRGNNMTTEMYGFDRPYSQGAGLTFRFGDFS